MKCPKCGTEMVWMGNVTILIKNTDKYLHKLTKKAFQTKDIEIWGADWDRGNLFCPNYLKCGNHPFIKARAERHTCGECQEWGTVNCSETDREPTKNDDVCKSFKAESEEAKR